jgi:hypothetical protein
MDGTHFGALTRLIASGPSRRDVVRGLAGVGLGLGAARLPDFAAAKKKKRKPKKPKPNEYGCLDVGKACSGDSTKCCSGICEGSKPKKGKADKSRCVAHDVSICKVEFDFCTTGSSHVCNPNNVFCQCVVTTGNAPFCGDFTGGAEPLCRDCSRDTDCEAEFGAGAACVVMAGICGEFCEETGGTACLPICKVPPEM